MAKQSPTFDDLWLLDGKQDFADFALKFVEGTRRNLAILTRSLDPVMYESPEFISKLSHLARSGRNAQICLLIKDTQPAIERGHALIRLAQRLPSKIIVRKVTIEPEDGKKGFMLCDTQGLLYQNDDGTYQGFANFAALREVKQLREQFDYLWNHAEAEPEFQLLNL